MSHKSWRENALRVTRAASELPPRSELTLRVTRGISELPALYSAVVWSHKSVAGTAFKVTRPRSELPAAFQGYPRCIQPPWTPSAGMYRDWRQRHWSRVVRPWWRNTASATSASTVLRSLSRCAGVTSQQDITRIRPPQCGRDASAGHSSLALDRTACRPVKTSGGSIPPGQSALPARFRVWRTSGSCALSIDEPVTSVTRSQRE